MATLKIKTPDGYTVEIAPAPHVVLDAAGWKAAAVAGAPFDLFGHVAWRYLAPDGKVALEGGSASFAAMVADLTTHAPSERVERTRRAGEAYSRHMAHNEGTAAGALLKPLGFRSEGTGGGCSAFMLDTPSAERPSSYVMITVEDDATVPEHADDEPIAVGRYGDPDECNGDMMWLRIYPSVRAFVADYTSDEIRRPWDRLPSEDF